MTNSIEPPKLALRLFRWYCRPDRVEELEGDLTELYELRAAKTKNKWKVDLRFWWDVIRCFKSYSRKSRFFMNTSGALYKSYTKLAMRQMMKNKAPIIINIFGLGLALGFCITVYMIYAYNWEFDTHFKLENVYRIHGMKTDDGILKRYESTPLPLEQALETEVAAVENVISYCANRGTIKLGDQYFDEYIGFAGDGFLKQFKMPLKYGSNTDLKKNTIILTEELSMKLFDSESPIGEILSVYINNHKVDVSVAGVFQKIPLNNSFLFNGLLSLDTFLDAHSIDPNDWSENKSFAQFVKISSSESKQTVEQHLQKYIPRQNEGLEHWKVERFELIPFVDPIMSDDQLSGRHVNSWVRPQAKIIFTVMAVLILFIACFNMANTTMALIAKRVKEIGVRKTLGSFNHQIFTQFLFEMMITMALSFVVALAMSNIIAKEIWGLFDVKFFLQDIGTGSVSIFIAIFLLFCTLITGLFPALYAWKFEPVSILNHKQSLKGVGILHKILSVAQYSFSIAVLVSGLAFMKNVDYLRTMDYGYDFEDTLILNVNDNSEFVALKSGLDKMPFSEYSFGTINNIGGGPDRNIIEIDTLKVEVPSYYVGAQYLTNMKVDFVAGRDFISGSTNDSEGAIVVNSSFAREYLDSDNALNDIIKVAGKRMTIVGITDDVITEEVYEDYVPKPVLYNMVADSSLKSLVIKTVGDKKEIESKVSSVWASTIDRPFNFRWQEDLAFGNSMQDSNRLKILFLWLAILGCVLSLIGIMSLASLNVAKKIKEISIRKVLGASLSQIMIGINKPFIRILGTSLVTGVLLGYLVADSILATIYKYYLDLTPLTGIPVGLFIVLAALVMTTLVVIKPATASPTKGLRTE
ncbi:MAG: FtsX-like permease family protein [Cyclobacteriaceae bacterium]